MTSHKARRACGLVLVALAVALSACGGNSDKDNYKKDAKAILEPVKSTFSGLGAKINAAGSVDQKIAEIDKARTQLEGAANKLDKLDPPSDVKTEHDNFVTELHTLAGDIGALEKAAKENDEKAAQAAATKLQADAPKVEQTANALEDKVNQ